uniref:Sorting nexin-9 n=1 Tax=Cacopsylla melanoneura TaxID=428564 RepID=A0A8D9BB20_9HEMI
MKVQALYDFHAEPGSAEIDIVTGEILTVTRKDVGEGWWEGTNQSGQTGLFPAAYVEEFKPIPIVSKPPGVPPPPLPTDWSGTTESNSQYMNTNSVSQVGNENSQYMNSNQSAVSSGTFY